MASGERIDGWKAIGAYFGRDRTTAVRWARDRGLPVRAVPGGRTRTVYALRSELDAWDAGRRASIGKPAAGSDPASPRLEPPPEPAPPCERTDRSTRPGSRERTTLVLAGIVACIVVAAVAGRSRPKPAQTLARPADPRAAALYVQALDDCWRSTAPSLDRAIDELGRVTRLDPAFAPAFAQLASAYILASQYGSVPDAQGMAQARRAAARALALDPDLVAARRVQGYVAYWGDRDRAAAGAGFAAALRVDPADALTHFWYADALVDNGEDAAARREYDAARLRDPGSILIRTERAWGAWSAGREAEGAAALAEIVAQAPQTEEAHDALSVVALARGDTAGYVREMQIRARLRREPLFAGWVDALARAQAAGGDRAALALMLRHALDYQKTLAFPTDPWPAFVASLAGDRAALLDILRRADAAHETWGMVAYQRRIAERWRGDRQITALLARRRPPLLEPSRS